MSAEEWVIVSDCEAYAPVIVRSGYAEAATAAAVRREMEATGRWDDANLLLLTRTQAEEFIREP